MEKELNCPPLMAMEIRSENLQNSYFNSNWDTPIDQNDPFESALSSMVSSPTTNASNVGDGMMIRELIGRLGSICDSGEFSPQSCIATTGNNSANTSCYSTPLNSPPKINLSHINMLMGGQSNFPHNPPNLGSFNPDPGFVERAAKFSCFGNNNNNNNNGSNFVGNLSRVSSNQSMRVPNLQNDVNCEKKFGGFSNSRGSTPENGEMGDSREGSSVSEQNPGGEMGIRAQNEATNSRKRKSIPKAKVKECPSSAAKDEKAEAENEVSNAKRSKADEEEEEAKKENAGQNGGDPNNNNNKEKQNNKAKPEPPKDYIHVRARRGQATDSHSLAERVRREKISERMKFLQDLVPGCNKVTGKATVLDEIINYVQSLQRQVEFLSMKLATVNPRMEFNLESLLSKDMFQSRGSSMPETMYPIDQNSAQAFPFGYQSSHHLPSSLANGTENPFCLNPQNAAVIRQNSSIQVPSIDRFGDSLSQLPNFWEDDLHSIVQMGIAQNQTQSGHGALPNGQMKVEL